MGLGPMGFIKPLPVPVKTRTCGCGYGFCWVRVWVAQKNSRVAHDNPYTSSTPVPSFSGLPLLVMPHVVTQGCG